MGPGPLLNVENRILFKIIVFRNKNAKNKSRLLTCREEEKASERLNLKNCMCRPFQNHAFACILCMPNFSPGYSPVDEMVPCDARPPRTSVPAGRLSWLYVPLLLAAAGFLSADAAIAPADTRFAHELMGRARLVLPLPAAVAVSAGPGDYIAVDRWTVV